MKNVAFLLGVYDRNTARTGQPVSGEDFAMIDRIAASLGVHADILFAVPDLNYAGQATSVKMADIRVHRPQVILDLRRLKPDVVVACGPVALRCLMDKGNVNVEESRWDTLVVPDLPDSLCVTTYSMEMVAVKPGTEKHLMLDVHAALHGRLKTKWGRYTILMPGTPEWDVCPEPLAGATKVGLDLETYPGLDPWHPHARIRMCVVSDRLGRAWVVQATPASGLPAWLETIITDPHVECGGSNIKFDYRWLARFGYHLVNMHDTSTAEHVLDSSSPLTDLKSLTFLYAPKLGDYSRGHRKLVAERGGWEHIHDHEMYQYCGADGEASIATMQAQKKMLKSTGLARPFQLSMALYPVLAEMETRGVRISREVHTELAQAFEEAIAGQNSVLQGTFGPINMGSHQQVAEALLRCVPGISLSKPKLVRQFSEQSYRLHKKEDPDQYSTDKAILEREAHKHPAIRELLLYRRLTKLNGTYITGLRDKHLVVHPDLMSYIHTSYRSDRVETGRLSSQGPNLQNIPRKPDEEDAYPIPLHLNVKRMFVSRWEGGLILEADAGQAEIRVAAGVSKDYALLQALTSGLDVHTAMCAQFHGKHPDQVTKLERTHGKRQTFLVLYGGGANTLSQQLGIPVVQAKEMLDQFFRTYPELAAYIQGVKLSVKRDLYSESVFGFRRRFRKPFRWDSPDGWSIERQAWNHQVQNGAACITFAAMIDLEKYLLAHRLRSQIIMQVHDSIVVDVYPGELDVVAPLVKQTLEHPDLARWGVHLDVPLTADIEVGPSWGEKEPLTV